MFKFSNIKKSMLLVVGISACLTIVGCANNDSSSQSSTTPQSIAPTPTVSSQNETPVEAPNGNVLQLKLEAVDTVNEADYVAILNKGKATQNFSFTAGGELAKVALCSAESEDGTKFTAKDEIDSYENLTATDKLCICIDIPEGMPNSMLVLTYSDKTVQNCLISYNGLDGGATLVPLNE